VPVLVISTVYMIVSPGLTVALELRLSVFVAVSTAANGLASEGVNVPVFRKRRDSETWGEAEVASMGRLRISGSANRARSLVLSGAVDVVALGRMMSKQETATKAAMRIESRRRQLLIIGPL
jgi:hypothetical protein